MPHGATLRGAIRLMMINVQTSVKAKRGGFVGLGVLAVVLLFVLSKESGDEVVHGSKRAQSQSMEKIGSGPGWESVVDDIVALPNGAVSLEVPTEAQVSEHRSRLREIDQKVVERSAEIRGLIANYDADLTNEDAREALSAAILDNDAYRQLILEKFKLERSLTVESEP